MWEVFECLFFFYFKSIDIGIFQMNSVPICQKILKAPKRFSNPCKNDVMMSTKDFSRNFKPHLRLFNKKIRFCSKSAWVQKFIARVQKYLQSQARITFAGQIKRALVYVHSFKPGACKSTFITSLLNK